jgi:hypothetical protein
MSSEHRELDPAGCALIRAFLTHDNLAVRQILRHAHEVSAEADDVSLACAVADMAALMLKHACGSTAQAVAEVQSWTDGVVKGRVDRAA